MRVEKALGVVECDVLIVRYLLYEWIWIVRSLSGAWALFASVKLDLLCVLMANFIIWANSNQQANILANP